ncbi:MAG TPA: ECF transporter S component [Segeticoccus sp.]|uniref:ECF transporter S component n=1 Tax=Segeticoccus sp. TaxID=2706531 RepID=UPI002D7EA1CB|nr:ECF transporter S component [Segeticoccus sp.]HET8600359.1 ECF transporter S component [Segeticoccus sp.]
MSRAAAPLRRERPAPAPPTGEGREPLRFRWPAAVSLGLVSLVGVAAFGWPFVVSSPQALAHGQDAPWFFAVLLGLLALVVLAEIAAGGLDAKTVAVLGVLTAAGGALRVVSAGTAGLEPMFFLIVLAGRVLGRSLGFVVGALALVTGAFLTGGVGPWLPFQMICMGWVGLGAALLPPLRGLPERLLLAGYGLVSGMLYGAAMNLWFWPFMGASAPQGAGFVPGADAATNLGHYAVFYVATSLTWDLPRGLLTAALVLIAGRPVLGTLRRAVRRASFGAAPTFGETSP